MLIGLGLSLLLSVTTACGSTNGEPPRSDSDSSLAVPTSSGSTGQREVEADRADEQVPIPVTVSEWTIQSNTLVGDCGNFRSDSVQKPGIFDVVEGKFVLVRAAPPVPDDEMLVDFNCAVVGPPTDPQIVYVVNTERSAQGLSGRKLFSRAYLFEPDASEPSKVRDISDVTQGSVGTIFATENGIVVNVETPTAGAPQAVFLGVPDLATEWTDDVAAISSSALGVLFRPYKIASGTDEYRVRSAATGQQILDDIDLKQGPLTVNSVFPGGFLVNGTTKGTQTFLSTEYNRVSKSIPMSAWGVPQLSENQLLTYSEHYLSVFDVQTGLSLLYIDGQEYKDLNLREVSLFDGKLYVNNGNNEFNVVSVDTGQTVSSGWGELPIASLTGWTLFLERKNAAVCSDALNCGPMVLRPSG